MSKTQRILLAASLLVAPAFLSAQNQGGLDPASIVKPLADSWPTYSGDYSGRRYSALTQINQTTVKGLSLAWVGKLTAGPPSRQVAGAAALAVSDAAVGVRRSSSAAKAATSSRPGARPASRGRSSRLAACST